MKKIIFGITGLTLGGAERVLVDISNRLVEKYDVTIFTIYANGELEKELSPKIHRISLYDYRYDNLEGIKKRITPLKVLLNKKKIFEKYMDNEEYFAQIAFLEGAITRIFSVKSKNSNTNKIDWIHNDISKVFGKGIKSRIKRILDRNVYEKYDTLAFVSIDNLDKFNKVYDDMDLPNETVINNYINSDRILKLAEETISTEKTSSTENTGNEILNNEVKNSNQSLFNGKDVNLLQVSRLVEQKAIDRLIRVHTKLIKEGYNHKIFVIGDRSIKRKTRKTNRRKQCRKNFYIIRIKTKSISIYKKSRLFMFVF